MSEGVRDERVGRTKKYQEEKGATKTKTTNTQINKRELGLTFKIQVKTCRLLRFYHGSYYPIVIYKRLTYSFPNFFGSIYHL